jgi:hypothetical protein
MTPKIVADLCTRVIKLEAKMAALMTIQKWQLGLLTAIVAGVLANFFKR